MYGAIIGDIAGSRFEHHNIKTKNFELFTDDCRATDDTVMTAAVARALLECKEDRSDLEEMAVKSMQYYGRKYPRCGFGGSFRRWVASEHPEPYGSYGNGSAMRVSPCGWAGQTPEEVKLLSYTVTCVTHNHPEGIKGAEAVAMCVYLARTGSSMEEIRSYVLKNYYDIDFTLDEIREDYEFDVTCQGSVPQALEAFFESSGFEDAVRNAVSIGGDSDTIAAITGAVAEAYYGVPEILAYEADDFLGRILISEMRDFDAKYGFTCKNGHIIGRK